MIKTTLLTITIMSLCLNSFAQGGFSDLGKSSYNNVHAIIVGISDYNEIKDLDYADSDAQLFYDILSLSFPESKENFKLIQNEEANFYGIKKGIHEVSSKVQEGDLFILYFSGHGDVMSWMGTDRGYFLGHDASQSREYEMGGAVRFSWVNEVTNGISAGAKADVWLLTDACHSGKVINQEGANATLNTLNAGFENTTKFISCQAHERSFEYASIEHGAFTYYLAKSLAGEANSDEEKGTLTVDEINSYMKKEVRSFTENKQTPRISASNEFKVFFNVNPEIASLIKDANNTNIASLGKGSGDTEKSSQLTQLETAIANGNLHGKPSSAYELLMSYKSSTETAEYNLMTELLIEALVIRGQRNTNLFLSGRPMLASTETMASTAKDIEIAQKLMGASHFMYDEVGVKQKFFEAMIAVEEEITSDYKKSESQLLALQKAEPNAAFIDQGLAFLYVKMMNIEKAEAQLDLASDKVTTWSKPRNTAAYINISNGNLDKANAIIKESESLSSSDGNISILKTQLYTANMELQTAEEELKKVNYGNSNLSEAEYYGLVAKVNDLKGRIVVAETYYLKAIKEEPKNTIYLSSLGELYKADGDTVKALAYFDKAAKLNPDDIVVQNNISQLRGIKTSQKKHNYYSRAEVLSVVDLKLSQNDSEGAISFIKEALKVSKHDPELDYALGKAYYANRQTDEAIASMKDALKKSPYHFEAIKSLTYMLILQKKFNEADAIIQEYNDNFKYSSKWRVFMYEAYRKMQKTENLIFILEEAIKLDSTDTEAYKSLYRLHMTEANYKQAEKEYNKLQRLGGRMKDSTEFINELVYAVEGRIDLGRKDNKTVQGLQLILDYDQYFLARMLSNARKNYQDLNYKTADIYLEHYNKFLFAMQGESKFEYFRIKAYLLLEVGMYQEALDLFKQVTTYSKRECYVGVAMAKYELGHDEQGWMMYFRKAKDLKDLNSKGIERYKLMSKNGGMYTPGGR